MFLSIFCQYFHSSYFFLYLIAPIFFFEQLKNFKFLKKTFAKFPSASNLSRHFSSWSIGFLDFVYQLLLERIFSLFFKLVMWIFSQSLCCLTHQGLCYPLSLLVHSIHLNQFILLVGNSVCNTLVYLNTLGLYFSYHLC